MWLRWVWVGELLQLPRKVIKSYSISINVKWKLSTTSFINERWFAGEVTTQRMKKNELSIDFVQVWFLVEKMWNSSMNKFCYRVSSYLIFVGVKRPGHPRKSWLRVEVNPTFYCFREEDAIQSRVTKDIVLPVFCQYMNLCCSLIVFFIFVFCLRAILNDCL